VYAPCGTLTVMRTIRSSSARLSSRETVAWPGNGHRAAFDATFSASAPQGAAPATAEFAGEVYRPDGRRLPPGTRIEAYVADTLCGVGLVRRGVSNRRLRAVSTARSTARR